MSGRTRTYRHSSREIRRKKGGPESGFWANYTNRFLLSLMVSFSVVLGVFHIPMDNSLQVSWKAKPSMDPTSLDILPPEYSRIPFRELLEFGGGVPITRIDQPEQVETPSVEGISEDPARLSAFSDSVMGILREPRKTRVQDLQILEFAEEQPDIIGGLNSLYLRIRYPKAAQESGIEGLVLVSFVVETDGSTSDIRVLKQLHPLCDQAAVDAIAETPFTPARQNGKRVRVRMHLPIRFILIDESTGHLLDRQSEQPTAR